MRKIAGNIAPVCALALGVVLAGSSAQAATPLGGLTVAVSPDGMQLVAGGDNRVLYVLDPASLEVKKRVAFGSPIIQMAFDAKGATLAVSDTDGTLHLIETKDWKTKAKLKDKHRVVFSARNDLAASADRDHRASAIVVSSTVDGKDLFRLPLPKEMPVAALGISPDGMKLAALLGANDDPSEPKVNFSDIPKDLKGLAKTDFQLRNDGKTSLVQIYDLKSGKLLSEKKVFFTMNATQSVAVFIKGGVVFNEYSNQGFQMKDDGEGRLVQFDGSFLYGSGVSQDGKYIMAGNLRQFALIDTGALDATTNTAEKLAGTLNSLNALPGWPEYFKGFDATANAKVFYGATSGYRVVMFGADGKVIKAEPIF